MKNHLFILSVLLSVSLHASAVSATPEPVRMRQPDGTFLTVRLYGNEHGSYRTDLSGRLLQRDRKGYLRPTPAGSARQAAAARARGEQKPTHRNLRSTFPRQGKVRSLVLLVNFTDIRFVTPNPQEAFTRLLNEKGYSDNGGTGSANDYFMASSFGQFDPQFDVYGPYDLSHETSYYGEDVEKDGVTTSHSRRIVELLNEACAAALKAGVDFTLYDEDNDGVLDNLFVYYAGYNQAEGGEDGTIWPHRSAVNNGRTYGGKQLCDYACTSELRSNMGTTMCGIGTFCHEFGHVLGLPDMYHTSDNDGNSRHYTVGGWDIMCQGSYNNAGRTPPSYTAFERFMLGWMDRPEQLTRTGNYLLAPLVSDNKAYMIAASPFTGTASAPEPAEYFLIENRQRTGWDAPYYPDVKDQNSQPFAAIPGTGLLITHITYNSTRYGNNTFNNYTPLGFDVVEAYNTSPRYATASDTYPGTMGISTFIPELNDKTPLTHMMLSNIAEEADLNASFRFGVTEGEGLYFSPQRLETFVTTYDIEPISYTDQELLITGEGLTGDSVEVTLSNSVFEICLDGEWQGRGRGFSDTISSDSTYSRIIRLRHTPSRRNCESSTCRLSIRTNDGQLSNQLVLTGTAPRPNYLTPVQTIEADNISPYALTARWEEQPDAEYYYFTLYTLKEEPSVRTQDFEAFTDSAAILAQGWQTNFVRTNTTQKKDGNRSVYFYNSDEYVMTEEYLMPVSSFSFWYSNTFNPPAGSEVPSGTLTVEAQDTLGNWSVLEEVSVLRTTRNQTKTYTFSNGEAWNRFRLTYHYEAGDGGVTVDAIETGLPQTPDYIFDNEGQLIIAPANNYPLTGLQPGTGYYYYLRCSENKGCEEHTTLRGRIAKAMTLPGTQVGSQFIVTREDGNTLMAWLPVTPDPEKKLRLYDNRGQLVAVFSISEGDIGIPIPTTLLTKGITYMLKYSDAKANRRQDLWAKFVY